MIRCIRDRMWLFLILLVPVLLLLLLGWPGRVSAKSYTIPAVAIAVTVQPDGSLLVVEDRTFEYTGAFSWVEQSIRLTNIEEIAVAEVRDGARLPYSNDAPGYAGSYAVRQEAGKSIVRWYFAAQDERRTFELSYRVPDAVRIHTDTAELYWQFIGDQWTVGTGQAEVWVDLPEGAGTDELHAWVHGPQNSTVSMLSGSELHWQATSLAPGTMLEGRVTFPLRLVPEGRRQTGAPGLSAILAEEQAAADRAVLARVQGQPGPETVRGGGRPYSMPYPPWLQPLLFVLSLGAGGWLLTRAYRLYSQDPAPAFKELYLATPPGDYPPAILGTLLRPGGKPGGAELQATLLDLSRRGYLTLTTESGGDLVGDLRVVWRGAEHGAPPIDYLAPQERLLTDFLFATVAGGQDQVLLSQVKAYASQSLTGRAMAAFLEQWQAAVQQAAEPFGFWDKESRDWQPVGCVCGVLVLLGGLVAFFTMPMKPLGVLLFVLAVATLLLGATAGHLTPLGANEKARWEAFGRYLTDYTHLEDATVTDLSVWERYMVYATVLGVAEKVRWQLKAVLPQLSDLERTDETERYPHLHGVLAGDWAIYLDGLANCFENPVTSDPSSSSSSSDSSSFSGGGGGGGGGGGDGGGGGSSG
ncbi:MAG: DUF2207 family protein [Mycobacterium leprae]